MRNPCRPFLILLPRTVEQYTKLELLAIVEALQQQFQPLRAEHETEPWIHQVAELPEKLTHVTEHRRAGYLCPQCHQQLYAPLPRGIEGEIFGPRLQSLAVYMKAALHGSYTSLEEFMQEVFEIPVSRSGLANPIKTVSPSLRVPYQELQGDLAHEPSLHVDETGHKDKGDRYWIWAFSTRLFGFFTVEASRGSQVLKKVLGETFKGTLISPSIAPTNNLAEQTIRTVVIDRKITQGTRSERGRQWSERIWTVLATCRKQKRSSWKFIQDCVLASRLGTAYPSLLPASV